MDQAISSLSKSADKAVRAKAKLYFSHSDERDRDTARKREDRAESTRIFIPACVNPQRRERCIADPQLFLKTYFADDFARPFGKLHNKLIDAIWQTATYGGKNALAAPRKRGKTTIVKGVTAATIFAGLLRFPVVIGPTTSHANELYEDFRRKCMFNALLYADFPEVCHPVRCLEGAPQRASRQHIDGELTRIEWITDRFRLANVPANHRGPIDYGGVRMEYRGLDAAIRGINRDGDRPDFIVIDEPDTRESARSDPQIADRENAIEKDIAGLGSEDRELAQVMITTIQNRKCISFTYTDPDQKPSWMGVRFGWVEKWPDEWLKEDGLWQSYIAMRAQDQRNGDRYGRTATQFYLDNREAMEAGGELLADNYESTVLSDGWLTIHSAWQEVFNAIADTSYDAFCTEYQNDPPESEQIQTLDLTNAQVASCLSGLVQRERPDWCKHIVRGIDMGKVNCWYVDIAFAGDGTGAVIDYGKFNTFGLTTNSTDEAIELAMLTALSAFVTEHDSYKVDMAFVDSGYKPEAIYEACRRIKGVPYYPVKGPDSNYRMPNVSEKVQCFFECHASQVFDQYRRPLWLFHPNTEYWKNWLQERWQLDPFIGGNRTAGSMTVFDPPGDDLKFHNQFSKSMVSERLEHIPLPGKGYKAIWNVLDRSNNHWLDAAGYACAAAATLGVRLLPAEVKIVRTEKSESKKPHAPKSDRFRHRAGGWIPRRGKR